MKLIKLLIFFFLASSFMVFSGCGGGGGDSESYGEVAIDVTDAKPVLPEGATNLWITFSEILVHKSGGGWISLPLTGDLPTTTIDLLQFNDGNTTELVPPVSLESGKYTQLRIVITEARIRFNDDESTDQPVEIPSQNLKTDKNFDFDVVGGGAVDIIIDFDLSQSIVVTDNGSGTPSYQLKPVLHIVDAYESATINGKIDPSSFTVDQNAEVTVFVYNPNTQEYEEYTKIEVSKSDEDAPNEFSIFWLVPDENYKVEIDFDPVSDNGFEFSEQLDDLDPGEVRDLNGNNPI